MDVQIEEEEEIELPSVGNQFCLEFLHGMRSRVVDTPRICVCVQWQIYPEINPDMTHVSYVNETDPSMVHLTVEYSFFK